MKLPETTPTLQAMFDTGHLFEQYAEELYPNNIHLGFSNYSENVSLPKWTLEAFPTSGV